MHSNSSSALLTKVLIFSLYALACVAYLAWGWSHEISDFGGDSSGYMLAAQYFSPFHAATPLLSEYGQRIFYPPLFPILIGLSGGSLLAGHLVVIVSLLGAFACLYLWLRLENLGAATSALTVLAFALMPGTYLQALNIWTENTFLFLSLLSLALVAQAEQQDKNRTGFWRLAAAVVGSSLLVRVAGLPLFIAFALRVLVVRPPRWLGLVFAAGVPFFTWMIWSKLNQTGIGGYTSQWATLYANDWLHVLTRQLQQESYSLLNAWNRSWLGGPSAASLYWLIIGLACICLTGWIVRLRRLTFDALYVLVYGLLLFAWPHPEEAQRYGYVLIPILISQGVLFLKGLSGKSFGSLKNGLPVIVLISVTIAMIPSLLLSIRRFNADAPADVAAARHTEWWYENDPRLAKLKTRFMAYTLADMRHVAELVPPGECIFSIKPAVMMLYSNRVAYPPPPAAVSDEEFNKDIKRCKFAYLQSISSPSYPYEFYPAQRLPNKLRMISAVKDNPGDDDSVLAILAKIED